jgi:hypothetical protein
MAKQTTAPNDQPPAGNELPPEQPPVGTQAQQQGEGGPAEPPKPAAVKTAPKADGNGARARLDALAQSAGPAIVVMADDADLTRMVHAQAAQGRRRIEDFNDIDITGEIRKFHPDLPDHIGDEEVVYMALDEEDFKQKWLTSRGVAVAVTRQSMPMLPDHCFNAQGWMGYQNKIVCVVSKKAARRVKEAKRGRIRNLIEKSQPVYEVKKNQDGDRMGILETTFGEQEVPIPG